MTYAPKPAGRHVAAGYTMDHIVETNKNDEPRSVLLHDEANYEDVIAEHSNILGGTKPLLPASWTDGYRGPRDEPQDPKAEQGKNFFGLL